MSDESVVIVNVNTPSDLLIKKDNETKEEKSAKFVEIFLGEQDFNHIIHLNSFMLQDASLYLLPS